MIPLAYFTDGDDVILIASNYGSTRHPAWYHNLSPIPNANCISGSAADTLWLVKSPAPIVTGSTRSPSNASTECSRVHEKRSGARRSPSCG